MVRIMYLYRTAALALFLLAGLCPVEMHAQQLPLVAMLADEPPGHNKGEMEQATGSTGTSSHFNYDYTSNFHINALSGKHHFFADAWKQKAAVAGEISELLTFEGAFVMDVVQLRWSVQSAPSIQGFKLERRTQSDDHWKTVTFLPSTDRENQQGYTYLDKAGVNGITYYRLRQLQSDGAGIPTPSIVVSPHRVPTSLSIWQHRLDPFSHFGTISFGLETSSPVTITIIDAFGRVVETLVDNKQFDSGHHIVPFDTEAMPAGLYTLRMQARTEVESRRLALI